MPCVRGGMFSLGDFLFTLGDMTIPHSVLVRTRALTGFKELITSLGGDVAVLLDRVGIDRELLGQPDGTLPLAQLVEVINLAGEVLKIDDIGLRLAQYQDVTVLGTVAIIAQHSATVGEALAGIARHIPYHTPGVALTIVSERGSQTCRLRFSAITGGDDLLRQGIELSYGVIYGFLRLVTNSDPAAWRIHFRHARGLDAAGYGRYFACPVFLGQENDELIFPSSLLDSPVDHARGELRSAAERFLSNAVRRFPLDIGLQVEMLVDRQLSLGDSSIERIAGQLGLQRRTLQRRLARLGLYFEDIVDAVRKARAQEYLQHAALPLIQVANLVGYNSQASLNRSCLRWFGKTPNQLRQELPAADKG